MNAKSNNSKNPPGKRMVGPATRNSLDYDTQYLTDEELVDLTHLILKQ